MPDTASTTPPRSPPRPSLIATAGEWIAELPGLIGDRIELLALELKRAGLTLAQMAALAAVAVLLGLTAWLALWALVIGALYSTGLHWSLVLLIVLAVNAAGALWALLHMRQISPRLGLPATRRHLSFKSASPYAGAPAPSPAAAAAPHGPEHHAAPDPVAADAARRAA